MPRHPRSPATVSPHARLLTDAEVDRLATVPRDLGLARVASRQGGPVSVAQLRRLGLGKDAVHARKLAGRLHSPLRGVYLPGHMAWDARAQLVGALLAVGDGWACGASTAWLRGMLPYPPPFPHLLRVGRSRRGRRGFALHSVAHVAPEDVEIVRGLPTVTPVRALLELAETASGDTLAAAIGQGEALKLFTRVEIAGAMQRWPGRRGLAPLHAELGDRRPDPSRSRSERLLRRLGREAGWPRYEANKILLEKERDAVFPEHRVVIEIDGREHFTEAAAEKDRRRDSGLAAAGFTTLRFSGRRLRDDRVAVAAEVAAVLAQAAARGAR